MDASPSLRSRKDLIVQFVDSVSVSGEIDAEWRTYVDAKRTAELEEIITSDRGRGEKKQRVLTRLGEFFERFFGLDSSAGAADRAGAGRAQRWFAALRFGAAPPSAHRCLVATGRW